MPVPTSVTPSTGTTAGGINVRIDGTGFVAGAVVNFRGVAAASVAVSGGGTVINCVAPANSAGSCDVEVVNPDTTSGTLTDAFTYISPPPTIGSVSPNNGQTTGGMPVTISGSGFAAGADVKFGGIPATGVNVSPGTSITCNAPANMPGGCDVTVTNPDTQFATLPGGFIYTSPPPVIPTISSVTPNTGPTTGGTAVTITGSEFAAGASVTFGGVPAAGVAVVSSTLVTCSTPANVPGGCDVKVTNPDTQFATLPGGFVYTSPPPVLPAISSVTPNTGQTTGGTSVTINGSGFATGAGVTFAGVPAAGVTVSSSTQIACSTPANMPGGCDVKVTNPDTQFATLPGGFVYTSPPPVLPTISSVVPNTGPTAGGTAVTINGSGFATGAGVTFAGVPASGVMVSSGSLITCSTPANMAGGCDVKVTNPDTQTATQAGGFVYTSPPPVIPAISAVTPNSGQTAGGTSVTITGSGFATGADVKFGGISATGVTVASSTSISCSTPANMPGGCDVKVTNPDTQTATQAGGFVYTSPPPLIPAISSVTPNSGQTTGGTAVTISGSGFAAGATVTFGGVPATGVTVSSSTSISCVTPANMPGGCDVKVTNPDGQFATQAGGFVYTSPPPLIPTIFSVTPGTGPTTGATAVTINGSGFALGASVTFGGVPAAGVSVSSSTLITCTTPANMPGGCDVRVTNPDTQSATSAGGFVYTSPPPLIPTISSVTPNSGPTAGETSVTITGSGFATGADVKFGGISATGVTVASSTSISCSTPANMPGGCDVKVTNPDTQSATQAGGFVYTSPPPLIPVISSVTPNSGQTTGGTSVTISGSGFVTGASVKFGGISAIGVTISSSTSISCVTPANIPGGCDVQVTNPDGQFATQAGGFVYTSPPPLIPAITSVTPNSGPMAGGTSVTITGSAFAAGATVKFAGIPATGVTVSSSTSISCVTPANMPGGCDVQVTNPDGQFATQAGGFVYTSPPPLIPTIASVTPNTGPAVGGTSVTISGSGFETGATVTFGGVPAPSVTVSSSTSINCMTPPNVTGGCDVKVTNPNTQSATQAGGFIYT
ncbi:MAG: hypothetical protein DWQ34_04640 [Planctomycetota bacterium]|nr:MAG: hypothetical protein DWQ34_04640 [Planctomycetota bacterium]